MREPLCQLLGKAFVALGEAEGISSNGHPVETLGIEPLPRQLHQSQAREDGVHALALSQSADVVESRIEGVAAATVALQTAARLHLPLKHGDPLSGLRQQMGAYQATEATSDDHYRHCFDISLLRYYDISLLRFFDAKTCIWFKSFV